MCISVKSRIMCKLYFNPPPSEEIAPLGSELWPFKEGNRQICLKIEAFLTFFVNPFSNGHNSGSECDFSKIEKPSTKCLVYTCPRKRIQVNWTSGAGAMAMQRW